jgi:hypothetical protein
MLEQYLHYQYVFRRGAESVKPRDKFTLPVTVAERSKAWTVFARSEAGIVDSNPTQGIDVWCVYVFILCLCCPVFR